MSGSSIDKLGIIGIRSYNDSSVEYLTFQKPLTVIWGQNGAGKTTVIECLKQITSGSFPPNSQNGKTFVIDSKFVNKAEVKGQIKLKFRALNGKQVMAVRTFNVSTKNKKTEFKTSESYLKTKTNDGETATIGHNCSEMDKQIPELLGVSKAVLENVIFCHQEESLWPFGESKSLQTIFDELFDTQRFTKIKESLDKLSKGLKKESKDNQTKAQMSTTSMRIHGEKAMRLVENNKEIDIHFEDLAKKRQQLVQCLVEKKQLNFDENEVQQSISALELLKYKLNEQIAICGRNQSMFDQAKKQCSQMHPKQYNKSGGECENSDIQKMQTILQNESEKQQKDSKQLSDCKNRLQCVNQELNDINKLDENDQHLKAALSASSRTLAQLIPMARQSHENDVAYYLQQIKEGQQFIQTMAIKQGKDSKSLETQLGMQRGKVDEIVAQIESRSVELAILEKEISMSVSETEKLNKEKALLQAKSNEIARIKTSIGEYTVIKQQLNDDLQSITVQYDSAQQENLRIASLLQMSNASKIVEDKRWTAYQLFSQMNEQQELIMNMTKETTDDMQTYNSYAQSQLNMQNSISMMQQVVQLQCQLQLTNNYIGNNKTQQQIKLVKEIVVEISKSLTQLHDQKQLQSTELNKNKAELCFIQAQNKLAEQQTCELQKKERKIVDELQQKEHLKKYLLDNGSDISQELQLVTEQLRAMKNQFAIRKWLKEEYPQQMLNKCEKSKQCSWCGNSISAAQLSNLRKKHENTNNSASKSESESKQKDNRQEALNRDSDEIKVKYLKKKELKDINLQLEAVMEIKEQVQEMIGKAKNVQKKQQILESTLIKQQQACEVTEKSIKELESLLDKVKHMDVAIQSLAQSEDKLCAMLQNTPAITQVSYNQHIKAIKEGAQQNNGEDLINQSGSLVEKTRLLQQTIMQINVKIANTENLLRQAQGQIAEYFNEMAKSESIAKALMQKKENMELLLKKQVELQNKLKYLKDSRLQQDIVLQKMQSELDNINNESKCRTNQVELVLPQMQQNLGLWQDHLQQIGGQKGNKKKNNMDARKTKLEEEGKTLSLELARLETSIQTTVQNKEMYQRFIDLLVQGMEIRDQETTIADLRQKISTLQVALDQKNKIKIKCEQINQNIVQLKLSFNSLEEKIKHLMSKNEEYNNEIQREELNQGPYANCIAMHGVQKLMGSNIATVAATFQDSIYKFHHDKIQEINRIIQDTWRDIYKGNDILGIKVIAEEDKNSRKAVQGGYQYKIVFQSPNHQFIEMKGRCSMGQKVLASIVIRLALAEAFSTNCGILALDEPTTNLDREHIDNLAKELCSLIKSRQNNDNFQLILITHDKEFVRSLKEFTDEYISISKDKKSFSVAKNKSIDNI